MDSINSVLPMRSALPSSIWELVKTQLRTDQDEVTVRTLSFALGSISWSDLNERHYWEELVKYACKYGHLSQLNWWKQNAPDLEFLYDHDAMDLASSNGHVAVLTWWKTSGLKLESSAKAMDHASEHGHIAVLEWWKASGLEFIWSAWAMDYASETYDESFLDVHKSIELGVWTELSRL
jgi:hypothetical protein